ncbi:alanine racemase [Helicobacter cappadocius]|uniref:Alanine racemase n=1 Tax=Helicobacter cappadocius TaxID=3063998 RepID=A0AA90PI03_9HELI|nr:MULTISPECIES: alanine racemase [unclassified Helicobacter]MDO7252769.1 alanine racemase [Helicobacter sp. faydin-H75]MDP2538637.1 alanine racemase [Helicobacter sp. faydin-H76]
MSEILINSTKFKNNLDLIAEHIGDKDKLALVMKDNAYGHGLQEIATLACAYGIKNIFVKNESEALKIAHLFEHITVLYGRICNDSPLNIHVSINSMDNIHSLEPSRCVELKVNTGMNRNGIPREKLQTFIEEILLKKLVLFGVFAHNGYGDVSEQSFQDAQKVFSEVKEEVLYLAEKLSFKIPRFHSLSSSGTLRSDKIEDDLVRIGIAAYGYLSNTFDIPLSKKLTPIASLWADKICEQSLKKGSKIGYGGKTVLEKDTIISTYDIGYGDGLFRINGNKPSLKTAEGYIILPVTSMDCFSCESTLERVCVFDDATSIAKLFDTIPYEVLTSLSPFIKRSVI